MQLNVRRSLRFSGYAIFFIRSINMMAGETVHQRVTHGKTNYATALIASLHGQCLRSAFARMGVHYNGLLKKMKTDCRPRV